VVFLGILNGAFLFAADLFRRIDFQSKISFVKLASYQGTRSSGSIKELIGWNEDIKNKTSSWWKISLTQETLWNELSMSLSSGKLLK